jgi:hypothetical protein
MFTMPEIGKDFSTATIVVMIVLVILMIMSLAIGTFFLTSSEGSLIQYKTAATLFLNKFRKIEL